MSLSKEDQIKIKKFSDGYNANKLKLPRTLKRLNEIKFILESRENYQFIREVQLQEISLK